MQRWLQTPVRAFVVFLRTHLHPLHRCAAARLDKEPENSAVAVDGRPIHSGSIPAIPLRTERLRSRLILLGFQPLKQD
jgi:hypothetical protein